MVRRELVGDNSFHPLLPEGAARLLVGQDFLQRHHLRRQAGDVLLRLIDDVEPLADAGDGRGRLGGAVGERFAHPPVQVVHALRQRALEFGLRRHGLAELTGDLALRGDNVVQPRIGSEHRRGFPPQQRIGNQRRGDQKRSRQNEERDIHDEAHESDSRLILACSRLVHAGPFRQIPRILTESGRNPIS